MSIEKRSYIEILYIDKGDVKYLEKESLRYEPFIIEEQAIQGFRFFDKDSNGKKINISSWTYLGKKISIEDVEKLYGNNPEYSILIDNIKRNKEEVCITRAGLLKILERGDMTYEDYLTCFQNHYEMLKRLSENLNRNNSENEDTYQVNNLKVKK